MDLRKTRQSTGSVNIREIEVESFGRLERSEESNPSKPSRLPISIESSKLQLENATRHLKKLEITSNENWIPTAKPELKIKTLPKYRDDILEALMWCDRECACCEEDLTYDDVHSYHWNGSDRESNILVYCKKCSEGSCPCWERKDQEMIIDYYSRGYGEYD